MKNKKNIYILLGAVLFIWGIVGYKIFVYLKLKPEPSVTYTSREPQVVENKKILSTDKLLLNYPDPFLKENTKNIKKNKNKIQKTALTTENKLLKTSNLQNEVEKINSKHDINWDLLKYSGMIKSVDSKEKIALLQYNSQSFIVKEGDMVKDFLIVSIYKDTIVVRKGNIDAPISRL